MSDDFTPPVLGDEDKTLDQGANHLRIEGEGFSIQVTGNAEFLHGIYYAVREELLARFASALETKIPNPRRDAGSKSHKNHEGKTINEVKPAEGYVWVCVCHDFYNKVHITGRNDLANSPLARFVDPDRLFKIFVERAHKDTLQNMVSVGRMLWSELTPEGQLRLGGDSA